MSFLVVGIVGAAVGVAKLGMALSGRAKRKAEQAAAKAEQQKFKDKFAQLDTSNPYANMENTMEDLTVNQQQAEFQAQQGQQQRANIMQQMQGAAGGSGIAALAQTMANQGQLASQQAGASIGMQESRNQMATAQQAAANQLQYRKGEARSQDMEWQKVSTQLGMASGRKAAADKARADAKAQQMSAVGDIGAGATTAIGGMGGGGGMPAGSSNARYSSTTGNLMSYDQNIGTGRGSNYVGPGHVEIAQGTYDPNENYSDRRLKKNIKKISKSPSGLNIYSFEFKDSKYGEGIFQGVMSDEVPSKVVTKKDGYDMVDYSKIDVEFKQI
jgi:hypothetical protein